jgi:serine/threonine-protein kinase
MTAGSDENRSGPRPVETVATPARAARGPAPTDATGDRPTARGETLAQPAQPDRIGRYRIEAELGRGGMGVVYRAHDPTLDRPVALKVLSAALVREPEFRDRFLREARALARVEHPNIVRVNDAGEDAGQPFFAMEFVEGQSVQELAEARGSFPVPEALDVVRQAAQGLDAAFAVGIIHRDIKPSNLVRDSTGRIRVLDFGLARVPSTRSDLTAAGQLLGTPHYMAPEQASGEAADHRSDIYALGATLYYLLTGTVPFDAPTPLAVLQKHISAPLPRVREKRPDVPAAVAALLERLLAKDPAARPQNYHELLALVDQAARGQLPATMSARPPGSFRQRLLGALLDPWGAMASADLDRSVRSAGLFTVQVALLVAALAYVGPAPGGHGKFERPRLKRAYDHFLLTCAAPPALALAGMIVSVPFGGRRKLARSLAAEAIAVPYVVLFTLAAFPVVGKLCGLAGIVCAVRARWAAVQVAQGLGRLPAFVVVLATVPLAGLILIPPAALFGLLYVIVDRL